MILLVISPLLLPPTLLITTWIDQGKAAVPWTEMILALESWQSLTFHLLVWTARELTWLAMVSLVIVLVIDKGEKTHDLASSLPFQQSADLVDVAWIWERRIVASMFNTRSVVVLVFATVKLLLLLLLLVVQIPPWAVVQKWIKECRRLDYQAKECVDPCLPFLPPILPCDSHLDQSQLPFSLLLPSLVSAKHPLPCLHWINEVGVSLLTLHCGLKILIHHHHLVFVRQAITQSTLLHLPFPSFYLLDYNVLDAALNLTLFLVIPLLI